MIIYVNIKLSFTFYIILLPFSYPPLLLISLCLFHHHLNPLTPPLIFKDSFQFTVFQLSLETILDLLICLPIWYLWWQRSVRQYIPDHNFSSKSKLTQHVIHQSTFFLVLRAHNEVSIVVTNVIHLHDQLIGHYSISAIQSVSELVPAIN